MKIYFAGSIRGGRDDAAVYEAFVAFLGASGEVLTEHVGDTSLTARGDDGPNDRFIHDRDMHWLGESSVVIAEVSRPSLGVGFELGWATALKKPVLCLYRSSADHALSAMIAGCPTIETVSYRSIEEAKIAITEFIQQYALP